MSRFCFMRKRLKTVMTKGFDSGFAATAKDVWLKKSHSLL
jgi:hypothetical protein